ncbi:hypothetical protein K3495_g8276 [Podosphaera aphanis]|nr:hypothetical protein K3495_g8276 [Podosphaera aphanis]
MESSSLTLGYDHARAASAATQSSDTTVAINEHTLAAGEFSKAASQTSSMEALRTLRLLEQHHQRLAQLLRFPAETLSTTTTEAEAKAASGKPQARAILTAPDTQAKKVECEEVGSLSQRQNSAVLRHPRRQPPRDLTSSIASNLASARGIRSNYTRQPLSPSVSIYQAPGSLESLPRRDGKRTKVPTIPENSNSKSTLSITKQEPKMEVASTKLTSRAHDGFSRFYNTFEDMFSKISAPLAFAGLPLTMEESSSATSIVPPPIDASKQSDPSKDRVFFDEIDLTKHFSRAALRASTRDDYASNDSFYVVPTTGHSVSYAHIISFDQKERQRTASSLQPDAGTSTDLHEDDFVDARETPLPATPGISRDHRNLTPRERDHKLEELTTENASLKIAMDKLSKRLHAFEVSAQYNSMALAESMRLMRDRSPAGKDPGKGGIGVSNEKQLRRQLQELEEQLQLECQKNDALSRDNEKLRSVVTRYRERWEKLKEGAKSRREGKEGGTGEL